MGNKIYFFSLGCPRNLVDSEVMLGMLLQAGYEITDVFEDADFIVVNTCGFIRAAREESLETIEDVLQQRKEGAKVIVTGCMVQEHAKQIKASFPDVHYLLGSGDVEAIVNAVQAQDSGEMVSSTRSYLEAGEVPRMLSTSPHLAYLKIAEGCRKRCSYCVIPEIKGPLRSKPAQRVIQEFRALRSQGVKEVILIAQDLGDWGRDIGQSFPYLLRELMKEQGDFWLRLLYLYPDEITEELIDVMKSDQRICPYIDMPIQHVNDALLRAMRRSTTKQQIIDTMERLRTAIPNMHIRTSLIVGFPGETEHQFEELHQFLRDHPIDYVGVFKYSPEENTHAATLPGQISEEIKDQRRDRLMQTQQKVLKKLLPRYVGKEYRCIVEGYHPESELLMRARHTGQCPNIDGEIIINDGRHVQTFGEWYSVKITDVAGYDLVGTVMNCEL